MALAIHDRKLYRAQNSQELIDGLPKGAKILADPGDLFTSAWPNTIHKFVEQQVGALPPAMRLLNNNPGYWFEELGRMATKIEAQVRRNCVKKNFTFNAKRPITALQQQEHIMASKNSGVKRKHLDKSLKIKLIATENPRRKGTHGFKSWEKMENGMTVAQFLQDGGRMNDLQWEVKKGHVTLS